MAFLFICMTTIIPLNACWVKLQWHMNNWHCCRVQPTMRLIYYTMRFRFLPSSFMLPFSHIYTCTRKSPFKNISLTQTLAKMHISTSNTYSETIEMCAVFTCNNHAAIAQVHKHMLNYTRHNGQPLLSRIFAKLK